MKKYWKTILLFVIVIACGLGYFYYLANKTDSTDATDKAVEDDELAALMTRNIEANYPQTPKEVVKLYARITKKYYESGLTDEQIEKLGSQARILFDDELRDTQTDSEFYKALKEDISNFAASKTYISDYAIESATKTKYQTLNDKQYASINLVYYVRQNGKMVYSYTKYVLRKDDSGQWHILFWELIDADEFNT